MVIGMDRAPCRRRGEAAASASPHLQHPFDPTPYPPSSPTAPLAQAGEEKHRDQPAAVEPVRKNLEISLSAVSP